MGLIKAAATAVGSTLHDQWKEYIKCDDLGNDILMKKVTTPNGIITKKSAIQVAPGQIAVVFQNGKILDATAEEGIFTFDESVMPSFFAGDFGDVFKEMWTRFTYNGGVSKEQAVFYINAKEIIDNKFGTPTPIPFRVVDSKIGLDVDVSVRCNGVYSYKITNPLLFYTNVCGNVEREYLRSEIDSQLKSEFLSHLSPSFAKISALEIRPNQLSAHNVELGDALKEELTHEWTELRGISIVKVAVISSTIPEEDQDMINELQRTAVMRDPTMAAARLVGAQAEAMKSAAANENGAMMGFMGMGMANQAGGMNPQNLFEMGQKYQSSAKESTSGDEWTCSCGTVSNGKFCTECGAKKPTQADVWICSDCGKANTGKFCSECGTKKPEGVKCDKCGWTSKETVKFCPECGNKF